MKFENQYIQDLIFKYLSDDLSLVEKAELDKWLENSYNKLQFEKMISSDVFYNNANEFETMDTNKAWAKLEKKTVGRSSVIAVLRYAAVVLPAIIITGLAYYGLFKADYQIAKQQPLNRMITPTEAILCLEDGTTHNIINKDTALVSKNANIAVLDNCIKYDDKNSLKEELSYHTVIIPKGMKYSMVLADGTTVWLNADTKFRYPSSFVGDKREVFIERGEAFFEVAKNKEKPFYVHFNKHKLKVTGTQFNVRDYENCKLTLLEGSVVVDEESANIQMKANDQLWFDGKNIVKARVEASLFSAWKDDKFKYRNARFEDIMNDLMRFYDIKVFYVNEKIKDKVFSLKIDRKSSFDLIADILNTTQQIKISSSGNNVVVE